MLHGLLMRPNTCFPLYFFRYFFLYFFLRYAKTICAILDIPVHKGGGGPGDQAGVLQVCQGEKPIYVLQVLLQVSCVSRSDTVAPLPHLRRHTSPLYTPFRHPSVVLSFNGF